MLRTEESVRPIIAKRLNDLMEMNHISIEDLSKATNVGKSTITMLRSGRYPMHTDILCKFADYFNVSTDYILGRCELGETYEMNMVKLREESYEKYLQKRSQRSKDDNLIEKDKVIESTYPYNLLEVIECEKTGDLSDCFPISDIQMEGLNAALETITERERHLIKRYYEEYKTLAEISDEVGVTRERVRQVIMRGIRKLRHPSRLNVIRYGVNAAEMNCYMKELAKKVAEIKEMEEYINEHPDILNLPYLPTNAPKTYTLNDMELSVRSYNCIVRSSVTTQYGNLRGDIPISYIEDLFIDDKILEVRNLGRKSIIEIATKLKDLGSKSEWVLKWVS